MEQFQVRTFRPIETKTENADQDRTVLRLCEGLLPVPIGALSSGPLWRSLWGISDLPARAVAVLAGADTSKAHFITVTRGAHVWLVVWSLASSSPLGMFYLTGATLPTEFDFERVDGVTVAAPNSSIYRNKNGATRWFASRVGDRWLLGNGRDENLQWINGVLSVLGPETMPADLYDPSRVRIPPCTSFVMSVTKSIFAAGNVANPKRVWITHPPTAAYPFIEGVYSLSTSFVDLNYSEATKITALSAYQNYVTAHTDAKPINLYDVDGVSDGWKCVQSPGAANCSAPSPAAVRDTNGLASFYLGADGEVYEDQAVRVGPYDKRPARDQDIATRLGAGDWNVDMRTPVSAAAHCVYDRSSQLFWMFAPMHIAGSERVGLWAFYERTRSVSGPISYPDAVVSSAVSGNTPASSLLVGVITASGAMLFADLANIGELDHYFTEADNLPVDASALQLSAAPTPTAGIPYVAATEDGQTFAEVLGESILTMRTPWGVFEPGLSGFTFTRFWKDAYLARFETGQMDFGDAISFKNYLELSLTFQRHSCAFVGVFVETDGGRRRGKWMGSVFEDETRVVPLNVAGRRIRVRIVLVLFNDAPALIRDCSIGWLPAGT